MSDMVELVDRLTVDLHEARRRLLFEFSGNISRDLRELREWIDEQRAEAGLGPSPVEPAYPDEEVEDDPEDPEETRGDLEYHNDREEGRI